MSFAVLTNPENGDKKSLRCNAIIAKASIIDSELMETMPKGVLASVGFDALCHCMEAYTSKIAQPLSDIYSLYGIELIGKHLVKLYQGQGTSEDWDAISLASTLGGMVIGIAGVSLAHGMEHPASGLKELVHGKGLAALTPVIVDASIEGCPDKFTEIAKRLGGDTAIDCSQCIRNILEQLALTTTLSEQGIASEDVEWMVDNCYKVSAAGIANHPVTFSREEIKELYLKAL